MRIRPSTSKLLVEPASWSKLEVNAEGCCEDAGLCFNELSYSYNCRLPTMEFPWWPCHSLLTST